MDSMTKQRREGEANRPTRAKTGQRKLIKPSWTEFVRLADQAVVAIAGADMINRAERRACGCSRRSRRLDTKWPGTDERQLLRQTKPRKVSEGRRRTRLASSRTGYVARLVMWRNFRESPILLQIEGTGRHITIRACWAAEAPFAASVRCQAQQHAWTIGSIEQHTTPANTDSNRPLRVSSGLDTATRRFGGVSRERSIAE